MINLYIALYQLLLGAVIIIYVLFGLFFLTATYKNPEKVPPLPTPKKNIIKSLELADLKKGEKFYDFGAGWGRAVLLADKRFQAEAVGYEYSLAMIVLAKIYFFLTRSNGKIVKENFLKKPLPTEGVVFTYLSPYMMKKLEEKIKKEKPKNLRVVSHQFPLPNINSTKKKEVKKGKRVYLYDLTN